MDGIAQIARTKLRGSVDVAEMLSYRLVTVDASKTERSGELK
jgi:hypothetical protein